jgi:penicillin V acylase-like amidase (Ntn superfamily)
VDDYPLYTMTYYGAYGSDETGETLPAATSAWACSLFAALGDPEQRLYGRNFDWDHSPAVLLFTAPPDGYASVSMVDIAFLGFTGERARKLDQLSLEERRPLLQAPYLPFDGMNEHGLVIGMAAVDNVEMPTMPDAPAIGSLGVIREMLDHAKTVDEAVEILRGYNVDMTGGPTIHYLIADATGKAALAEFNEGKLHVIPMRHPGTPPPTS